MANWFVHGGDGLTTGYWAIQPWKRATSYVANSYVRQRGGAITIGIAMDFTHTKFWFKDLSNNGQWNDSATDDPGTNTGGITNTVTGALFPAVTSAAGAFLTANFGATAFVGSLPTGFSSVNTAAGATVTWDPANKNTNITLVGGNLIAQGNFDTGGTNPGFSVRATSSFSTGLVYFEVTYSWGTPAALPLMRTSALPDATIGAVNSTFTIGGATIVSGDVNSIGWFASSGLVRVNNVTLTGGTLHSYAPVAAGSERIFKNKSGSTITSGATQPSWNLGGGTTTSDGGGTWTEVTGTSVEGWNAPWARMGGLGASRLSTGDTVFVSETHTECISNSGSLSFGSTLSDLFYNWYSVDHSVASPGSGNLLAGATIYLWANTLITGGNYTFNGITMQTVGISLCVPTLGQTGTYQRYDNCNIIAGSAANQPFVIGSSTKDCYNDFNNCTISATVASQPLRPGGGRATFKGGSISTISAQPVFGAEAGGNTSIMQFDSVDMSGVAGVFIAAGQNAAALFECVRCKIPSVTFFQNTTVQTPGWPEIKWYACDTGTDQEAHGKQHHAGFLVDSKTVIRTGGASDSLAGFSEKIATTSSVTWQAPFISLPMNIWNATTGANRTGTLYGIVNGAAVPTNAEIWPELRYLGSASSLLGSLGTGGIANFLASGSNWTADTTSAWDSQVPARQNTHTYAVGDVIKVATNPGRVFFCTASSGNTAGSEPGGYATAVDGGAVTDGSATFRAGFRFSMAVTLSAPQPQLAGLISIFVKIAKASTTFYIDPPISTTIN